MMKQMTNYSTYAYISKSIFFYISKIIFCVHQGGLWPHVAPPLPERRKGGARAAPKTTVGISPVGRRQVGAPRRQHLDPDRRPGAEVHEATLMHRNTGR